MNIKTVFLIILSLLSINLSYSQSESDFQILDTYYTENNQGITITIKVYNNNNYEDTLNMFNMYLYSDCLDNFQLQLGTITDSIPFYPNEIKEITPQFCINYPNQEYCESTLELSPFISTLNTINFTVIDQNSNCLGGDICDDCSELHVKIENISDIDYLNSIGVEKTEIFNTYGQQNDFLVKNSLNIVVFYFKNGTITTKKVYVE